MPHMTNKETPLTSTSSTGHNPDKSPDFLTQPAIAARNANLALALERELRESSGLLAAMAA
jgi:hypothetical protein